MVGTRARIMPTEWGERRSGVSGRIDTGGRVDDCVFCDIVRGRAVASMVDEDDQCLAFLTIEPVNPGHVLVVPKRHVVTLAELDEELGAHLFRFALRVNRAIRRSGLRCEGVNLFLADGAAAFQDVFHLHLHVFPRFHGDAFRLDADWSTKPSRTELDEVAARLRAVLPVDQGELH